MQVPNCSGANGLGVQFPGAHLSWCLIVLVPYCSGAKLSWCPIVLVPICPGALLSWCPIVLVLNCPGAHLSWCQIIRCSFVLVPIYLVPNYPTFIASARKDELTNQCRKFTGHFKSFGGPHVARGPCVGCP